MRASASPKTCGWRRTSFACDGARDAVEVAVSLLLEQEREEVDLEEQVAELVEELGRVVGERGVGDLVGLLDGVRDDRASRLLAIPGALGAQAPGQLLELVERRVRRRATRRYRSCSSRPSSVVERVRRLEARGVRDLALVLLLRSPSTHSLTALFFRSSSELGPDRRLDLRERGVTEPALTAASGWIRWYPNSVLTGGESSFVSSMNAALSNGATVWPRETVSLPPWSFEPGRASSPSRAAAKSAAAFELLVELVGLGLRLDEDVPHLARLGDGVLALVLVVVLLRSASVTLTSFVTSL